MARKQFRPEDGSTSASSKFGQMIGEAFEKVVIALIVDYLEKAYPDCEILEPSEGAQLVTLKMLGGSSRQLDTVITMRESDAPVALLETKWLKDARHHNDKGAWILQLREVKKRYATIRGAAAVLAGYWTEGVGIVLMSEGGIKMVLVATDEEIYSTIQPRLDEFLGENSFVLNAEQARKRYPRPWDLANCIIWLEDENELGNVAESWLHFEKQEKDGKLSTGEELIKRAIDELLSPLPEAPQIRQFKISLEIDTGNVIYQEFVDVEEVADFVHTYYRNPEKILERISP
ncbi:MAG: hypothetical protein B6I35_01835 [Anaerolineaceae bacterium 4572_32.2]|nr:MAG: hypothetical protein B6I35_01835 [Anaerolineaceae bacterium 4572_32.2]RLC77876.1 MAG: hypothetical protein DRI81_07930 [Chloroflexota bacterium]HEY72154.1 hypothetical protein [Thermoflexia bacterium]